MGTSILQNPSKLILKDLGGLGIKSHISRVSMVIDSDGGYRRIESTCGYLNPSKPFKIDIERFGRVGHKITHLQRVLEPHPRE